MKLSAMAPIIAKLYTDKFSSYRHKSVANAEDGTTGIDANMTTVLSNVNCRISRNSPDSSTAQTNDRNVESLGLKIFCSPGLDIKKGDKLVLSRTKDGITVLDTYTGIANEPQRYETHTEVLITEQGEA